jgi:hypothetical protein
MDAFTRSLTNNVTIQVHTVIPPDRIAYFVIASVCIANVLLVTLLVAWSVTRTSRKVCRQVWDQVCQVYIGSDDEGDHEMEEKYMEDVGRMMLDRSYNRPLFFWTKGGSNNRYVYNTNPFRNDQMSVDDQRKVHIKAILPTYMPRKKAVFFIVLCVLVVAHTSIHLLGFLAWPLGGPDVMMIPMVMFFVPKGMLMLGMTVLSIRNNYQNHAAALYGIPLVCLAMMLPKGLMNILTVPQHISPFFVLLDWLVILCALRLVLWFPRFAGSIALKDYIHRYIRASVHDQRTKDTRVDFVLRSDQRDEDRLRRRANQCLPQEVDIWETSPNMRTAQ